MTAQTQMDQTILRNLFAEYAEEASLPVHREKANLWQRLNRLEAVRPLVWINEIPWQEMNIDDELTVQCADPYCRSVEMFVRQQLYQWRHMPCDMVLDPVFYVDCVCSPTSVYADYGMRKQLHTAEGHHSVGFKSIIASPDDIAQIRMPEVTVDWEETERRYTLVSEIADGILPVEKRGITHQWFSPWDQMIQWYGIEQLYMDMVDRPEFVHQLLQHFMAISHAVLDQQEAMGLLAPGHGNHRVGSGGLGITDVLPRPDYTGGPATPKDQWGTSTGQIFSEVSPEMHEEFSL